MGFQSFIGDPIQATKIEIPRLVVLSNHFPSHNSELVHAAQTNDRCPNFLSATCWLFLFFASLHKQVFWLS
jgi:hypothetical protein